jgi:hypothetical protein
MIVPWKPGGQPKETIVVVSLSAELCAAAWKRGYGVKPPMIVSAGLKTR